MPSLVFLTTGHTVKVPQDPDQFRIHLQHQLEIEAPSMFIDYGDPEGGFIIPIEVAGVIPADGIPEDFELLRALGDALGSAWQSETIGTEIAKQSAITALQGLEGRLGIENMPVAAIHALTDLTGGRE